MRRGRKNKTFSTGLSLLTGCLGGEGYDLLEKNIMDEKLKE